MNESFCFDGGTFEGSGSGSVGLGLSSILCAVRALLGLRWVLRTIVIFRLLSCGCSTSRFLWTFAALCWAVWLLLIWSNLLIASISRFQQTLLLNQHQFFNGFIPLFDVFAIRLNLSLHFAMVFLGSEVAGFHGVVNMHLPGGTSLS